MSGGQMLRSITPRMGFFTYLGGCFQALFHPCFGKLPVVCVVV